MTKINLTDVHWDMGENLDGLLVRKEQEITPEFLKALEEDRQYSSSNRAGEYHKLASIPVVVVEKWLREGFDIYREDAKSILKKLRDEDLTAFIATTKRI